MPVPLLYRELSSPPLLKLFLLDSEPHVFWGEGGGRLITKRLTDDFHLLQGLTVSTTKNWLNK